MKNIIKQSRYKIIVFTCVLLFLFILDYVLAEPIYAAANITNSLDVIFTGINCYVAYLTASYTNMSAKYQKQANLEKEQIDISNQATKVYTHMIRSIVIPNRHDSHRYFQPVLIGNSSNEPIYKIFVISCSSRSNFNSLIKHRRNDNINKKHQRFHAFVYLQVLMPGHIYKPIKWLANASGGEHASSMIFFTDSRGNKWVRDAQGNLSKLPCDFDICNFNNIDSTDISMPIYCDNKIYNTLTSFFKAYRKI